MNLTRCIRREGSFYLSQLRHFSVLNGNQLQNVNLTKSWENARHYEDLPGPSKWGPVFDFLPGGELHNANLIKMNHTYRTRYGDIFRLKGLFGKPDVVFTYNPNDFEMTYRTEGVWPQREGLESFGYYRREKRPELFQGVGGLVTDQGKAWADIRNKVNPVLMKVQNVRQYLPEIDQITQEFLRKLEALREPATNELTSNFHKELKMWSFEAISLIALNTRMGLLSNKPDQRAHQLAQDMEKFFNYSYEFDVAPAFWEFYETSRFKRFMAVCDSITNITIAYIEEAMKRFEAGGQSEAKSVLEKLCHIDKQVAVVMAIDMMMAGLDTTSSAFVSLLYLLATNPTKQDALRQELVGILPHKDSPLTQENTRTMPYLRACMKEALRITPITPSNFRMAGQDIVLSGYRIPKGVGVLMGNMALSNSESFFPRSAEFLPERWLKSGPAACPAAKAKNPFVYLPFGFGPRTCIGKRVAEMEIETLMARLIRNYRISWMDNEELKYISNIILIPHGAMKFRFDPCD